ncbi:MAG: VOC family protein [Burkholderiaceae bacterium]
MRAQLKHVGIYVQDIDVMTRYYTEVFGLVVTDTGVSQQFQNRIHFLSADAQSHHQLVLIGGRDVAQQPSTVNQLSFKVERIDDLRTLHERLQRFGNEPVRAVDHGNSWSLYARDPEGNGIEAYLDTPWHVSQPHARPLDLDLADDELLQSTRAAVLRDPTYIERSAWSTQLERILAG